jgi:hypothetical protein
LLGVGEQTSSQQGQLIEVPGGRGIAIGRRLMLKDCGDKRVVYFHTTAIHIYDRSDKEAEAACIGTLSRARLASDVAIANAFGIHRNTVGRISARFAREGMAAVVPAKRGPKGPSKVTDAALSVIASNVGMPVKQVQEKVASERGGCLGPHLYRLVRPYRPGQAAFFREAPGDVDDAGGPAPEDLVE